LKTDDMARDAASGCLECPGVEDLVGLVAAQEFSSAASAAVLGGFALIFGLLVWRMLRSNRDLPPGYGTPGTGQKDRRAWAGIALVSMVGCLVLAVVALAEAL